MKGRSPADNPHPRGSWAWHRAEVVLSTMELQARVFYPGMAWHDYLRRVEEDSRPPEQIALAESILSRVASGEIYHLDAAQVSGYGSTSARRAVREADKVCRYCMAAPADTLDHVIPRAQRGSNSVLNVVGCCADCNARKGNRTPRQAGMVLHLPLRFFDYARGSASA